MKNLLDALFLPVAVFKRLNDNLKSLVLGIIFLGIYDIGMFVTTYHLDKFYAKSSNIFTYNFLTAILISIIIGFIDVVCFSLPLSDLFRLFVTEVRITDKRAQLIKLMKVYILSHFAILPFVVLIQLAATNKTLDDNFQVFLFLLSIIITVWQAGIMARGIHAIYNFDKRFRGLIFIIVYAWFFLLSEGIGFIEHSLALLFRG